MNISSQFIEQEKKYNAHNYSPLPVVLSRGEGVWVTDVEDKRYLDMMSAYSALNFGHLHPELLAAMQRQIDRLTLTSRAFYNDQLGPWSQELSEMCNMEMVLPMNTGAEAVETAIKLARKWAYQVKGIARYNAEIIVCTNNFHGRTISIVSFSTEEYNRADFGPFTPGYRVVSFGQAAELEQAIGPNTAACLIEPIQGEGGVIIPPKGYLKDVREICDRHKVLMMLDEIQTGLGRTGELFCYQHEDIQPDVLILGKALGGGLYPISAVVSSRDILGLFQPGEHGSTFGGNPLACAISRAALSLLQREQLAARSKKLGQILMRELKAINNPLIKEVRGLGLMIGIEFVPEAGGAKKYSLELMREGLLCKETHYNVLRLAPPLIISETDLQWAIAKLQKVLSLTSI
jgi:ornithine--oxo-acid transaminase